MAFHSHLQGEGRDALRTSQGQLGEALAVEGAAEPIGASAGALQRLGHVARRGGAWYVWWISMMIQVICQVIYIYIA